MYYGAIKKCDIANGEGCRVSLFVSGCRHHCKGCFNAATWDFTYGTEFIPETEEEILNAMEPDYIHGLTLLGGEPFEPSNQQVILPFLKRVKEKYPKKTVWCYTGYRLEKDLLLPENPATGRLNARCACTDEILAMIDVLVDGRFVLEKKDIALAFKGSSNQRIIDLRKTLAAYFDTPEERRNPKAVQIIIYNI